MAQITDSLSILLDTQDIAIAIEAEHFCVTMRGVQDESSVTYTQLFRGQFQTSSQLRNEFIAH